MTSRTRRSRARRRGNVLVLVALLLFGLLAIAALTIDVGLARLTQSQMQAGVDATALEGLRVRDDPDPAFTGAADPVQARRQHTSSFMAAFFDDDLDPTNGDLLQLGAGPVVDLTAGLGDMHASALITVPASPVYDPVLELNVPDNLAHGDLVSGAYDAAQPHDDEDATYARSDFTPAADAATSASALLVRLRRTDERNLLDRDPGVSSSGPALPLLFGRGSLVQGDDPLDPTAYSVRRDGLTVRATAIADLRPVVVAGHPVAAPSTPGVARVALLATAWSALPFDASQVLDADAAGVVRDALTNVVGVAYVDVPTSPLRYGAALAADAALPGHAFSGEERWLPLVAPVTGAGDRVVGFGRVELTGTIPGPFTLTKRAGGVAHANASAIRSFALPADLDTAAELAELTAARDALVGTPADVLMAPVLVR